MKKLLALVLAASMILAMVACGQTAKPAEAAPAATEAPKAQEPAVTEAPKATEEPAPAAAEAFLWDNFDDRDPNNKPELAPNGVNIWWDNWANLRAKNEDGAIKLDMRPKAFDPEDFESEADYYAHAADWMANWGEAVNMWALDGISWCKYLTIRIKGAEGGEETKLIMDWHPEDARFFAARFTDLVLADGSHPVITTEWQDLVIDLEASGFPGMTNAFHIRAFDACVIWPDEITFTEPVAPIDATSQETILAGITVPETGKPGDLPIAEYLGVEVAAAEAPKAEETAEAAPLEKPAAPVEVAFLWDNFDGRDPNAKPDLGPNGVNIWWDNWANLRGKNENDAIKLDMRPKAYDPEDYETEADYYAHAADWMANWGEAVNMWALEGISWCKYLTICIRGAEGGEETKLIMDWHPEDAKFYAARFSDLVLADGSHPVITTEWQYLVIDLEASGFPGMTNAFHIRAFAPCVIWVDDIGFAEPVAPIDTTDSSTIQAGMTVAETGKPGDLPIQEYLSELPAAETPVEVAFLWDNFDERDPNNKPELGPNGVNIWWDNWANLRGKNEDGAIKLDMRPKAFDKEDYENEDAYYAHAADWMANWGEAVNMWALENISWCKYLVIRVKGETGGEETRLIMDWHPEDAKFYAARFCDLVLADGSHPVITTGWQTLVIDLEASGFPGMTNAFHIRAFAPCVIWVDEIGFAEPVAPIDTTDSSTIQAGMTAAETGKPGDLPIKDYLAELG